MELGNGRTSQREKRLPLRSCAVVCSASLMSSSHLI